MHYYSFSIKDYKAHTDHLTEMEDLAYRRMIDWCYLHERGLPNDIDEIAKKIRMRTHSESIANVLREFWVVAGDELVCPRISEDLSKYREKSEKARESAKARWSGKDKNKAKSSKSNAKPSKPQCEGKANAMRTHSEGNANHKPITNNQEPILKDISIIEFESFWEMYPRKTQKLDAEKAWIKLKPDKETFELIAKNIEQRLALGDWSHDEKQYIPHASTYLNRERWIDEIVPRQASSGGRHSSPDSAVGRVNAAIDQRARERAEAVQSGRVLVHENGAGVEAS